MMLRPERPTAGMSRDTEEFPVLPMSTSPRVPFIALRRQNASDSRNSSISESIGDDSSLPHSRNSSVASVSSNRLTGSPGYVYIDPESQVPTKMLPRNPRHVRGGSINNDLSDIHADQIIQMRECDSDMLVPLLHRHHEMQLLMRSNASHFARLRASLGQENYSKAEKLWTSLRAEIDDSEWLRQTQEVLTDRSDWSLWCDIIGWESTQPILQSPKKPTASAAEVKERRRSTSSLMEMRHTIHEEEE